MQMDYDLAQAEAKADAIEVTAIPRPADDGETNGSRR